MFLARVAWGDWRLNFERAGYTGKYAVGVSYEITERHALDYLFGTYDIGGTHYYQSTLLYHYSHWNVPWNEKIWRPLQIGAFGTFAHNTEKFFTKSPDKYPSPGYYDQTAMRWGIEAGTMLNFPQYHFAFAYKIRMMDTGVIALYNNTHKDLQYFVSSGIALQYIF